MSNETKNLEELSKPVAWSFEYAPRGVDYGFKDVLEKLKPLQVEIDEGVVRNVSPLYSQEYVNALIADHKASQDALKSVTELWNEQRQRIAEYERILDGLPADAIAGGWTARGIIEYAKGLEQRVAELEALPTIKHMRSVEESLIIASDRAEEAETRIAELEQKLALVREQRDNELRTNAELEKRLAMPVRLPQRCRCEGYHIDEAYLVEDDEGDCFDRDEVIEILREQGFNVEGDA